MSISSIYNTSALYTTQDLGAISGAGSDASGRIRTDERSESGTGRETDASAGGAVMDSAMQVLAQLGLAMTASDTTASDATTAADSSGALPIEGTGLIESANGTRRPAPPPGGMGGGMGGGPRAASSDSDDEEDEDDYWTSAVSSSDTEAASAEVQDPREALGQLMHDLFSALKAGSIASATASSSSSAADSGSGATAADADATASGSESTTHATSDAATRSALSNYQDPFDRLQGLIATLSSASVSAANGAAAGNDTADGTIARLESDFANLKASLAAGSATAETAETAATDDADLKAFLTQLASNIATARQGSSFGRAGSLLSAVA